MDLAMKGGRSKSGTKKTKLSVTKKETKKSGKAAKDPNKPKRPASAFFVFMEEFRGQYKKDHPKNKSVSAVSKAAGDRWKSLSDADKAPYVAKAEKRKAEYEKKMNAYNRGETEPSKEEEDSEVNDDEDGEDNNEEDDDVDDDDDDE